MIRKHSPAIMKFLILAFRQITRSYIGLLQAKATIIIFEELVLIVCENESNLFPTGI